MRVHVVAQLLWACLLWNSILPERCLATRTSVILSNSYTERPDNNDVPDDLDVVVSDDLPAARHQYYIIWAGKAYRWLSSAILRLRSGRSVVIKWFRLQGVADSVIDTVIVKTKEKLGKIREAVRTMYIDKGDKAHCEVQRSRGGSHGTLAYVYPGEMRSGRWMIRMCDFAAEFKGDTSTQTLVHELSHHMGTTDEAYGKNDCLKLRPEEAIKNADTYALFVADLGHKKASSSPHYEEGSAERHPLCNMACDADEWVEPSTGTTVHLDRAPSLKHCLFCEWVPRPGKLVGLGRMLGILNSSDAQEQVLCGDGSPHPVRIEDGDCDTHGCQYIRDSQRCLEAAVKLGYEFPLVSSGKHAKDKALPFGCHMTDDTLSLNLNARSEADASPEDAMLCMCPTNSEYGDSSKGRSCCVEYECEEPRSQKPRK